MADEIVTIYKLDATQWEKGADTIKSGSDELVDENKKLETSFGDLNKKSASAFATDKVKAFQKEAGKALKDTKKEADNLTASTKGTGNAFLTMRKQLKETQSDLVKLAAAGRENSKLFKTLTAEAGKLKDGMADLGATISLQAGDPIENLSSGVGQLKNSFTNLDFEGVGRSFGGLAANISKIKLSTFSEGLQGIVSGIGKLGAAIITSPVFLFAGAIAGIVAGLLEMTEASDEQVEALKREKEQAEKTFNTRERALTREIELMKARGQESFEQEKELIEIGIRRLENDRKIAQAEIEVAFKTFKARSTLLSLLDGGASKSVEKRLKLAELEAKGLEEIDQNIADLKNDILILEANRDKDARDKAKAASEKAAKDELDRLKKLEEEKKKVVDKFNEQMATARFNESQQAQKDLTDAQKKLEELAAQGQLKEKQTRRTLADDLRDIQRENLFKLLDDQKQFLDARFAALEVAREAELISEEEFNKEYMSLVNKRIDARKKELDVAINLAFDLISLADSFAQIARERGMENAEAEKALAIFGLSISLAQSLGNAILAATEAGVFTGAAAPITTIAFIAQMTAAVGAAFAQAFSIVNKEVPSFAEGGYTGHGGKYQAAGTVHKGEWVSTQATTSKYWDELEAMHTGTFGDLLMYKYIGPALEGSIAEYESNKQLGFAESLASSLMLNGFKGNNIVKALVESNADENKRHKQLVGTLKKGLRGKSNYRKK